MSKVDVAVIQKGEKTNLHTRRKRRCHVLHTPGVAHGMRCWMPLECTLGSSEFLRPCLGLVIDFDIFIALCLDINSFPYPLVHSI
jgi:hypothetical protein